MQLQRTINWIAPLDLAASIPESEDKWVLLYSGMNSGFFGRYSILALRAKNEINSDDFTELSDILSDNNHKFTNGWFGYLGYGLKNKLEKLSQDTDSYINMPHLWLINFGTIILFDHEQRQVKIWSEDDFELPDITPAEKLDFTTQNLRSNMNKAEYLDKVDRIKSSINRGDLYQANLTRKFTGEIAGKFRPVDIFCKLCEISPAPYSAFLKFSEKTVISSSPERFLHINSDGVADTRPIKGSAARFEDEAEDKKSLDALGNSEKDRAENLMIVDLCRNDLSRGCEVGSIKVKNLFEITSYATVHHMVSTVTGQKSAGTSSLDLVKGCFPPGSMTGAPKIKAMQLCSALESKQRGVYSGAIGWFGGDGSVDLSVVIRTIIMDGNKFEFQVGGAIVADSDPIAEFEETLIKAKAVAKSLGIDKQQLRII